MNVADSKAQLPILAYIASGPTLSSYVLVPYKEAQIKYEDGDAVIRKRVFQPDGGGKASLKVSGGTHSKVLHFPEVVGWR